MSNNNRKEHYSRQEKIDRLLKYTRLDSVEAGQIAEALGGSTFEMIKQVRKQLKVFAKGKI